MLFSLIDRLSSNWHEAEMIQSRRICSVAAIIFCLTQILVCPAAIAVERKQIVLLYSFGRDVKPWVEYAKVIRSELDRQSPWPLDIIEFSLVTARAADANSGEPFVNYLDALFAKRPPDLIVSIGAPAAVFVQQHRPQLFSTTPMVIAALEQRRIERSRLTENDTVVAVAADFPAIIENILRVLPDTKTVAVVIGDSPNERFWLEELRKEFPPFADRLSFIWYNDRPFADILKHAAALPPHSAIFYFLMNVDAAGVAYEGDTALQRLSAVANAPIFTHDSAYFGNGIVGGPMHSVSNLGRLTATAAVRILKGERASDVRIPASEFASPIFDWRQMQRWGITESRLPPGSKILFREPTAFERYSWQIALIIAVILAQAGLISGLLNERRQRRLAEVQSRQRMAELAHINRFSMAGELTASIAHEMNQPLGAILANAEVADAMLNSSRPNITELKDIVTDILRDNRRATEVIRGMRGLLKKAPFETKTIDLNDLVRETVKFLSALAIARRVEMVSALTPDALPIFGDPIQLQQVILNLVVNAIDAMKDTPIQKRVISIRTSRVEGFAELSVSDRGSGIPEDKLQDVFKPFYTSKAEGMGLGLSIARTIIESHQGRIWAINREHGGASFRIKLPLVQ